jgi:curved DNA-binding protein CbpA
MSNTGQNHYEFLGVERTATPEEIKRAWAKLVRIHTPDKDPDGNRQLNEAKATLLDPSAKQDYDSLLDYGDEITELLERAIQAESDEFWDDAIDAYTEILAFHPSNHAVRNKLALCQSYSGNPRAAVKTLEQLIARIDTVALYWSNLAHILSDVADSGDSAALHRSQGAFERAAELEPFNAAHQIALSRHWRHRKDYKKAEHHIELAVSADGQLDLDDLEALFELPWIHLFAGQESKVSADAKRIRELIPGDNEEALEYAAFHFLRIANELADEDHFSLALTFIKASRNIQPIPTELQDWAKSIERTVKIIDEGTALRDDSNIIEPVRVLAQVYVGRYLDELDSNRTESLARTCLESMENWRQSSIRSSFERLRIRYPQIYDLNAGLFNACKDLGESDSTRYSHDYNRSSSTGSYNARNGGCGCSTLVVGIAAILIAVCCVVQALG